MEPPPTAASIKLLPGVQWPGLGALPRFLALPPLFGQLVTRGGLDIRLLTDDGKLAEKAEPTSFQAFDGESLVRRFLGDLDRFVGKPFASALCGRSELRDVLAQTIGCTLTLAEAIADDLQPVFGGDGDSADIQHDPNGANGLVSASDVLRRLLCHNLFEAYSSAALVQYEAQASLPWTGTPGLAPLALHGPARIDDEGAVLHFAAARTGVANGDRFATFVAEVDEPARHRWVGGQLQYTCTHAEFGLPVVAVPPGCDAPNEPCVVPLQRANGQPAPLLPSHPGALRVPVPLRSFPALPVILGQAALPTHAQPSSLDEMPLWTYGLTFKHEFAAQDTVRFTVDFNQDALAQQNAAPLSAPDELFDSLARYTAVADKLWALLEPLTDPQAVVDAAPPGVNAAHTFLQLACAVAQHWSARLPAEAGDLAPQNSCMADKSSFALDARVTYSKDGKTLQSISLKRGQTRPGPVGSWPGVEVVLDSERVALEAQIATSDTMLYLPPAGTILPALDQQTLRIAWGDINISEHQNASARILVVRNQELLYDPLHADDPALPTNPRLLLKTAEVRSASLVRPLIHCFAPQEISGVDTKTALTNATRTLFPPASAVTHLMASWQVSYVYKPALDSRSQADSPLGKTPVALCSPLPLNGAADGLAAAVKAWTDENHPASAGGGWLFGLTLFSGLEPEQRPLFHAELLYRLG